MRARGAALALALLAAPAGAETPAPFPVEIEVAFDLVDQTGARMTEADLRGGPVVLFFGYAACQSICDVALPAMAEAIDALGRDAERVTPVMITVDPARDTPEALAAAMPRHHPRMVGLTGSDAALAAVRERFQVEVSEVAVDAAGQPILAHGSFIYLIDADGRMRTLLPPILGPDRIAELIRRHLLDAAG